MRMDKGDGAGWGAWESGVGRRQIKQRPAECVCHVSKQSLCTTGRHVQKLVVGVQVGRTGVRHIKHRGCDSDKAFDDGRDILTHYAGKAIMGSRCL